MTYQAVHKWLKGGNVSDENLEAIGRVYGVSTAWLKYGVGPQKPGNETLSRVGEVLGALDVESQKTAIEHIRFLISRQSMPAQDMAKYLSVLDGIRASACGEKVTR